MRISKKILAIALSILMAVSMMPFTVFAATTGVANGAELKAAVESAASGDTIEFTADNTTYPGTDGALVIDVNGKNITIDLKGHTQYFRVSGETTVVYETALFYIHNGAKLTITDSVGGGAIYMTYGANSPAYMFIQKNNANEAAHTSELVINGGKFVSDAPKYGGILIYQNYADATTTINGGVFETTTGSQGRRDYIVNESRGELEINGGTFTTSKSGDYVVNEGNTTETSLTINGGEFNGRMVLDTARATTELNGGTYKTYDGSAANTDVSAYLPADQIVDSTTGQIKNVDPSTVARTNSAEFTSLKDALDSVAAGATATITLLDDCTLPSTYEITDNQKITIDLNGNDITTTARAFNIRHGQLTIKGNGNLNANFTGANAAVAVYGAATDSGSNYSTFTLTSTATINAPNGYGAMIGATSGAAYGAKLQLSGTINSKYGVYINGNVAEPAVKTNAAAINITGTVTASNENAVVYAAGYAKWNISSNANLTGGSGVYIKSGTMNIYGNAVITATGEKTDYKFNTNGADGTGDAIIIDSCGYPGNVPTVTIKAGTITSANGAAVASYTKQDDPLYPTADFPRVDNVVPGTSTAVFSSDVSALAAEGYETTYDETKGGYVVEADNHTVAKIGKNKYDTFEAAWNAAKDGDTITLVKDCAGNGLKAPQGKFNTTGLTVDFNGKTYTIDGDLVGSTGTQSQAFQLLKENKITFENGTIYSEKARMLVQNYSDLTLDGMTLTLNNTTTAPATVYTLSNNNGTVVIDDTTINANPVNTAYAFDVCRYSSYQGVNVTVTGNSQINGDVQIDIQNGDAKNGANLVLESGTMTGDIDLTAGAEAAINDAEENAGVTKASTFNQAAPEGYEWVEGAEAGTQVLAPIVPEEPANGSSLALTDKIETTIYIDADAYNVDASEAVVKATYNHNAADTAPSVSTDTYALSELTQYSGQTEKYVGTYMFTYACAPAQLTEDCTVELYANAEAAEPVYSQTYSAKSYCDKVNAAYAAAVNPDAALTKLNALCDSLVDYAKAAQFQFNYSKDLTDPYRNEAVQTLTAGDITATANVKTSDVAGFAFDCQDELNILVYTNSAVAPTGVSMNATKYADKINAAADSKDSTNFIRVKGLGSGNINKVVTVNTANGDITVSANAIVKAYLGANVSSNMKDLARAIYLYGAAAADYFGA